MITTKGMRKVREEEGEEGLLSFRCVSCCFPFSVSFGSEEVFVEDVGCFGSGSFCTHEKKQQGSL